MYASKQAIIIPRRTNGNSFGRKFGNLFVVCVIICFIHGTSLASEITDSIVLNCTAPKFMTRKDWLAVPPQSSPEKQKLPMPRAIIAHTATALCKTEAECKSQVRSIQTFHIETQGLDDIAYNFLVGGDGAVYEGRGWDNVGAHTKGFNRGSICIAFIGTFNTIEPSQQQLCAAQKLLEEGVSSGKLASDYGLYGHRQFSRTISPGDALYKIIQTWPHWRKN